MTNEETTLLTVTQAAKRLGISVPTLRKWADTGEIGVVRLPSGYRRFELGELDRKLREMGFRGAMREG